jgi:hypothetical protein
MMSKTANNTGGVSVQEELLPLKSGVPAGVAMLPHHNILKAIEKNDFVDLLNHAQLNRFLTLYIQ